MGEQITIFDVLYPDRIDPIREVALYAGPQWTTSRKTLIDLWRQGLDIKQFADAVKNEYCPYGLNGSYGIDHKPNSLLGFDMLTGKIKIQWYDSDGEKQDSVVTWRDFAREIGRMIDSGEYKEKDE